PRSGDVAGVDHVLDARRVEQLDDPPDVRQEIVRIADDADPHRGAGDARRERPLRSHRAQEAFSRMWIAQALPRPITWVMPSRAPSTWRFPASPRRWVDTS